MSAYALAHLRETDPHIAGDTILVEGVEPGHDSARMAAELRANGFAGS
jgi:hypothetical protein